MPYPEGSKINWQPYSQRSFDLAKRDRKPIMMLISAKWCHSCHIYEEETLESDEISKGVNKHFLPIFADADKRQDLARQFLVTGYPTTILFNYGQKKVASISGHVSKTVLNDLLREVLEDTVLMQSDFFEEKFNKVNLQLDDLAIAAFQNDLKSHLAFSFDDLYGGFELGQKFPSTYSLEYVLSEYMQTRKNLWRGVVEKSLNGMQNLMDKEAGGFYRYSTMRDWSAPHYEKMLLENAQISGIFIKAGKALESNKFIEIAKRNYSWLQNTLYDEKNGGFYGSQASDGHYFNAPLNARKSLKAPSIDKTKFCDWNCETVISFLHAHKLLANLQYWEIADKTLSFISEKMISADGGAYHYFDEKEGAKMQGLLSDNAWAAVAFLEAYRLGKQGEHLTYAKKILDFMLLNLYSESDGAFIEHAGKSQEFYRSEDLKISRKPQQENAIACKALFLAHEITFDERYIENVRKIISNFLYVDNFEDAALVGQIVKNLTAIPKA
jgi:uncharacterized protein YyaL (SSP411 family)